MIALWSLWSKPLQAFDHSSWQSPLHHLLSWVLSVETARKHYPETVLITDDEGLDLLVHKLGLVFTRTVTDLNQLRDHDPQWWALGKLYSYRLQKAPFVHIDSDVYLWNGLPDSMESSPLLCQNPEYFVVNESWYHPEKFATIKEAGGWIPEELQWFMSLGPNQKAECCGILGGNDLDFISYYAEHAIRLVEEPVNHDIWKHLGADNILVEQYYLSACYEYHRTSRHPRFKNLSMSYIFQNSEEAFSPEPPRKAGFTHLIGGAKKNRNIMKRLEQRVERDYPLLYHRCLEVAKELM